MALWDEIKFDEKGLIPAIAQDADTMEVLMLAYMNEEALKKTLEGPYATYFSRSRQQLWVKGETSGNLQQVVSVRYDCDGDAILVRVRQKGAACHTGEKSCFYRLAGEYDEPEDARILGELFNVIQDRKEHPSENSYTNKLFLRGLDRIIQKVGEESIEVVIAGKNQNSEEISYEAADLFYHLWVLLAASDMKPSDIYAQLRKRR